MRSASKGLPASGCAGTYTDDVTLPSSSFATLAWVFSGAPAVEPVVCTQSFEIAGAGTPQDLLDLFEAETELLHPALSTTTYRVTGLELKIGPTSTGPTFTRAVDIPGAQSQPTVDPNTALLVRKSVTVSARFAGRLFWPGIPRNVLDSEFQLSTGALEQFQDAFDAFFAACVAADASPVIDRRGLSDPRAQVGYEVQARPATQRRRLRR